jgi:NAD(P)-dependent dehydrogenase (short-subunit alcohol dehydrogenase family)
LASEGAAVVLADVDHEAARATAATLSEKGHAAVAVACDVRDEQQVEQAVGEAVTAFGGVDILLNNAGLHLTKYNQPFSVLPRADLRALLEVNVVGVVNCSVACRDTMGQRGHGAICNISSIAGHMPTSPYGMSKLAVRALTQAFATEFAPDGIRVNAVSPGLMATENALADLPAEMIREFAENRQLVHRTGSMTDVVQAVLFLCSDEASFITGETLKVSGGYPLGI